MAQQGLPLPRKKTKARRGPEAETEPSPRAAVEAWTGTRVEVEVRPMM